MATVISGKVNEIRPNLFWLNGDGKEVKDAMGKRKFFGKFFDSLKKNYGGKKEDGLAQKEKIGAREIYQKLRKNIDEMVSSTSRVNFGRKSHVLTATKTSEFGFSIDYIYHGKEASETNKIHVMDVWIENGGNPVLKIANAGTKRVNSYSGQRIAVGFDDMKEDVKNFWKI